VIASSGLPACTRAPGRNTACFAGEGAIQGHSKATESPEDAQRGHRGRVSLRRPDLWLRCPREREKQQDGLQARMRAGRRDARRREGQRSPWAFVLTVLVAVLLCHSGPTSARTTLVAMACDPLARDREGKTIHGTGVPRLRSSSTPDCQEVLEHRHLGETRNETSRSKPTSQPSTMPWLSLWPILRPPPLAAVAPSGTQHPQSASGWRALGMLSGSWQLCTNARFPFSLAASRRHATSHPHISFFLFLRSGPGQGFGVYPFSLESLPRSNCNAFWGCAPK
jgi:hypothetical protein